MAKVSRRALNKMRNKAANRVTKEATEAGVDNAVKTVRNAADKGAKELEDLADSAFKSIERDVILEERRIRDGLNYKNDYSPTLSPIMRNKIDNEILSNKEIQTARNQFIYNNQAKSEMNIGNYPKNNINAETSMFGEISDKKFEKMDKKAAKKEKKLGIDKEREAIEEERKRIERKPMSENKLSKEQQEQLKEASKQRLKDRGVDYESKSPGDSGNQSAAKHLADKIKGDNTVYRMAVLGVGGGLVLNMANNKGQQSNAQLYGQY